MESVGTMRMHDASVLFDPKPLQPTPHGQQPGQQQQQQQPQSTERKVAAFKFLFVEHYLSLLTYRHRRVQRMDRFREDLARRQMDEEEAQVALQNKYRQESDFLRKRRLRLRFSQFRVLKKIGQGGYGEVYLCQKTDTDELCAVKRMNKIVLAARRAVERIQTERDVLATAKSDWLVKLLYSFQDDAYVYLAMEYVAGGDLRTLLCREVRLVEGNARFYMAEAIAAVATLHALGFIHRDLKPENFLISHHGHLKLTDFGMAKGGLSDETIAEMVHKLEEVRDSKGSFRNSKERRNVFHNLRRENRARGYTIVGSPDYMAPEIVMGTEYNLLVDYWALGCMMFEMVAEFPPFYAPSHQETFLDIVRFDETLQRPEYEPSESVQPGDRLMSDLMWHLVTRFLNHTQLRWGNSLQQIQQHPWFAGVVWERLHEYQAPYVPFLSSATDTSNFDDLGSDLSVAPPVAAADNGGVVSPPLSRSPFVGFTFRHEDWMGTLSSGSIAAPMAASIHSVPASVAFGEDTTSLMDLDDSMEEA